jgi:hypothetical protein
MPAATASISACAPLQRHARLQTADDEQRVIEAHLLGRDDDERDEDVAGGENRERPRRDADDCVGRAVDHRGLPTIEGSAAKRRRKSDSPINATGGPPGLSSPRPNVRPRIVLRPRSGISDALIALPL